MKITDLVRRLTGDVKEGLQVTWRTDPAEGVDFLLPDALSSGELKGEGSAVAILQWATLRSAEEAGLAVKNHSGYTVFSDDFSLFEPDFYDIFDFPVLFKGTIDVDFSGGLGQAEFTTNATVELTDGSRVRTFELHGPFLSLGPNERYRLNNADYQAIKSLSSHRELGAGQRSEYANGLHVHELQTAKNAGAQLRLAHFEKLPVVDPQSIGVVAETTQSGDLLLSPAIPGTAPDAVRSRLQQLNKDSVDCLRVKNHLVILKPEARQAVEEVLTNGRIPKDQIASFIKNPTAYINAAMIDLDTGFSMRMHGAERFELRYFGETEAEAQDWFGGEATAPIVLHQALATIKDEATLNEIKERVEHAKAQCSDVFDFEGIKVSIEDMDDPVQLCEEMRPAVKDLSAKTGQDDEAELDSPELREERATVAIDANDEETLIAGKFDLKKFDPSLQRFSKTNLARSPFPHQEQGIRWLLAHMDRSQQYETGGALLADDMGLGKTFMALTAMAEWMSRIDADGKTAKPHLIVAPVSLLENWKNEVSLAFKRSPFSDIVVLQAGESLKDFRELGAGSEARQVFSTDRIEDVNEIRHSLKIGSVYGDSRLDMPNRLVLTTYQTLRDYQFSLSRIDWGAVVFDEAQNIKNPNALVTRAAKGLKSDFKLLATGTPVENSLKDFWCLMDTCTPGLMGSWQEFRATYIQRILEADNESNVKQEVGCELKDRAGNFMLRRTKEGSLDGLPEKTLWIGTEPTGNERYMEVLAAQMPEVQKLAYDDVINGVRLTKAEDKRQVTLGALQALRSICIHPALNVKDRSPNQLSLDQSGKMMAAFALLEDIKRRDEKVIIFLVNKRAQQLVSVAVQMRFGLQVDIINGDTKTSSKNADATRQGIINKFQSGLGFNVIIMSPIAAGVGLTVTAANNVIHLERHWNPAKEAQATDRVYRIGQDKPVNVYLPVAIHPDLVSFDERLNMLLRNKVDLSDAVVTVETVSDDEMMNLFDGLPLGQLG